MISDWLADGMVFGEWMDGVALVCDWLDLVLVDF